MNRGCVIGLMVAMLLLGVGGYFFYKFFRSIGNQNFLTVVSFNTFQAYPGCYHYTS